jgi:starvation-inducible DNA-binding protein
MSTRSAVLKSKVTVERLKTGIGEQDRPELRDTILSLLADTYVLFVKTQSFHWNVVGPLFYSLHKLSEAQYQALFEAIDEIAERVRALGYPVPTSLAQFANHAKLDETDEIPSGEEMIDQLVADHESVTRSLRAGINTAEEAHDSATVDLLTRRIFAHEKDIWMLRSLKD